MLASTGLGVAVVIFAVLALVGVIAFLYWLVRLLVGLVKLPSRLLRRPASRGLGADYEQFIVETRKASHPQHPDPRKENVRPLERREPFPPHDRVPRPAAASPATMWSYRRKLSWTVSIIVSLFIIGACSSIASPFMGLNGQNAVSGVAVLVVVIPLWVWSYQRGRFPPIRIGSPATETREFETWRAARDAAEVAEFLAWRAEKAATQAKVGEMPPPQATDSF